jgi:hypothetical protein
MITILILLQQLIRKTFVAISSDSACVFSVAAIRHRVSVPLKTASCCFAREKATLSSTDYATSVDAYFLVEVKSRFKW